jgi:hypothetical protein
MTRAGRQPFARSPPSTHKGLRVNAGAPKGEWQHRQPTIPEPAGLFPTSRKWARPFREMAETHNLFVHYATFRVSGLTCNRGISRLFSREASVLLDRGRSRSLPMHPGAAALRVFRRGGRARWYASTQLTRPRGRPSSGVTPRSTIMKFCRSVIVQMGGKIFDGHAWCHWAPRCGCTSSGRFEGQGRRLQLTAPQDAPAGLQVWSTRTNTQHRQL